MTKCSTIFLHTSPGSPLYTHTVESSHTTGHSSQATQAWRRFAHVQTRHTRRRCVLARAVETEGLLPSLHRSRRVSRSLLILGSCADQSSAPLDG